MMSIEHTEIASGFSAGSSGKRPRSPSCETGPLARSAGSGTKKLTWYLNRLLSMSGPEVAHRVLEQARRYGAGHRAYTWLDFEDNNTNLPRLPITPTGLKQLEDLRETMQQTYVAARSRSFEYLGVSWPRPIGSAIWHLDPVSGFTWPSDVYCFHAPYRENAEMGDVKLVWELNRLQFLQPIAALSALTNDPEPAEFCLSILDEWMDANPPFQGINWVSGIELALRVISILTALSFIDPDLISAERRIRIAACLKAHGYWLMRYPSRFSSANNHLVAEAAALFALGTCWPDLPQASDYARYGHQVLSDEVKKQIHDDGVGAEQSPTYTAFTLEWYLLSLWIGEETGTPFEPTVRDRLDMAGSHLRWLMDSAGHTPKIGDDDEGRVFAFSPDASNNDANENYVSSILASLSAVTGNSDVAPPIVTPHLRDALFGRAEPNTEFVEGVRTFDSGGYTIFRRTVNGRKVLLVLDHGPLGHLSIAAHGHADALSIWLHIDDQPVFVDAGTYLYHAGGAWRDYFRSTRAHNTLAIGRSNSSTITGPFNWGARANCQVLAPLEEEDGNWSITVAHDGYQDQFNVQHQRTIRFLVDGAIEISDRILGEFGTLPPCQAGLLMNPGLTATRRQNEIEVSREGQMLLSVSTPDRHPPIQIENGGPNQEPQYSGAFGSKEAACRLRIDVEIDKNVGSGTDMIMRVV